MVNGAWCVGLSTLLPSGTDCLEIWEPKPAGTVRPCPGLYVDCFTGNLEEYMLCQWSMSVMVLIDRSEI